VTRRRGPSAALGVPCLRWLDPVKPTRRDGPPYGEAMVDLRLVPTGRKVRVDGATFTVMNDDGLVAEDHHYFDLAGLLTQLGALG
jgi:hypothetical protein